LFGGNGRDLGDIQFDANGRKHGVQGCLQGAGVAFVKAGAVGQKAIPG
jgi:hypothetical protein